MSMNFSTDVSVNDGYKLSLNGMKIFYGTCNTAASTPTKAVTCSAFTSADLTVGTVIFVMFTYKNTHSVLGTLGMSVNGTTSKLIKKLYNAQITNLSDKGELVSGIPLEFVYNGAYWVLIGSDYNSDTTITNSEIDALFESESEPE